MVAVTFDSYPPWQQIDDYANIAVTTTAGTLTAAVTEYRCLKKFAHGARGCDDALSVKDALLQTHKEVLKAFGGGQNIVDIFTGKASVATIARGLGAVFEYRRPFVEKYIKSPDPNRRKAAEILATPSTDVLARFAYAFIGLDCNGFVGNYLRQFPSLAGLTEQHAPSQWYKSLPAANFRKNVAEFEVGDVVIASNFAHIGVVDSPGHYNQVDIAQSGGKIMYSSHKITKGSVKDRGTLFTIDKPSGGFAGCPTVYVARAVSNTAHGHVAGYEARG
ncbi:MAG: hypothetical protein J0I54_09395 [Bosea sp.]|uniref:hypothetical protein n=1 Tax=unclassified Bosea (in: a-proteobacteria) TaxID=2653178 RepID=UPI00095B949B|nr:MULTISPECIES: hypothetical protein [unclassified Bosea (in: a-proteobacteria)]MBN9456828.1 hypothetical protein [Bosea sp. (in: a-proteobacteria)]OJV09029.1 MAG: hypothetical protein BGO20_22570 [Bosea sp. 67-29]